MRQYLQQIPHVMRTCKQHGSSFNGLLLTRGAFKVGVAAAFGVATEAPIHLAASECCSDVSDRARSPGRMLGERRNMEFRRWTNDLGGASVCNPANVASCDWIEPGLNPISRAAHIRVFREPNRKCCIALSR
jgi:hypothetical protein